MSFGEYLLVLRRRWRVWVAFLIFGIVAASLVNLVAPNRYTATATSFVTVASVESSEASIFQGSQFTVQRVKSYIPLVSSRRVLGPVVTDLGLDVDVPGLREQVEAATPLDTALIQVSATDADPEVARAIANAVSAELGDAVEDLETPFGQTSSEVRFTVTNPAETPGGPSFPNVPLNLLLGAACGLACGLVAAVLWSQLDRRVKRRSDLREITGSSPLGVIGEKVSMRAQPVLSPDGAPGDIEAFRMIRSGLKFAAVDTDLKHFAVVSSTQTEGKSSVACNVALTWALSGASVCLVESDMRRPRISTYLGIEGAVGLSDVLVGDARLEDALCPWRRGTVSVLPAGSLPPDPVSLLESDAMKGLVSELAERFDVVVYDTPPLLAVTDALVLGHYLDGVVLVVRSGATNRDQVALSLDQLTKAHLRLLGTVLTFASVEDVPLGYDSQSPDTVTQDIDTATRLRAGSIVAARAVGIAAVKGWAAMRSLRPARSDRDDANPPLRELTAGPADPTVEPADEDRAPRAVTTGPAKPVTKRTAAAKSATATKRMTAAKSPTPAKRAPAAKKSAPTTKGAVAAKKPASTKAPTAATTSAAVKKSATVKKSAAATKAATAAKKSAGVKKTAAATKGATAARGTAAVKKPPAARRAAITTRSTTAGAGAQGTAEQQQESEGVAGPTSPEIIDQLPVNEPPVVDEPLAHEAVPDDTLPDDTLPDDTLPDDTVPDEPVAEIPVVEGPVSRPAPPAVPQPVLQQRPDLTSASVEMPHRRVTDQIVPVAPPDKKGRTRKSRKSGR